MKSKILKNANYIGLIIIILTFVFLYFSYFFIYIPKQEYQVQQRAFRILKEYGSNMFDKYNYYQNHFDNYGPYYAIRYFNEKNSISEKEINIRLKKSSGFQDIIKVVNGLQTYVINDTIKNEKDSLFVFSDLENRPFLNFFIQVNDTIRNKLNPSIINFYKWQEKIDLNRMLEDGVSNKVPIDTFMNNLKFDQLFENIVLFDSLKVYYNSNHDLLIDITNPGALRDSIKNVQGGIWKTLSIRGEDKYVIILPIDFAGKRFYLAGFILDSDYRNKTRTINSQLLILIAGILLLVFIGMPILKIIFIDPKERLKAMDASGSAISTIFGTGLLVLIAISILKHQYVDRTLLAKRIENISDSLYSNVTANIDSIKNLYSLIIDADTSDSTKLSAIVSNHFNGKGKKFIQYEDTTLDFPFPLNEIIQIDTNGIVQKAVTRTPFSDAVTVNLSSRQYFINAKYPKIAWPTKDSLHFYIESIKSYNTGKGETAISFNNDTNKTTPVMAFTSAIPSLYSQVLPKDIEFIVINETGKVLYHSITSKNLHENFLDESGSDLQLTNAINLRVEDLIQIDYNEKKWLARIKPIENTPLYHITLLDLNQADNRNARIFLFTFYFWVISLLFIGFGMIIMRWFVPPQENSQKHIWFLNWLNFEPEKYWRYKSLLLVLGIVIILQFSGIFIIHKPIALLVYQLIFIAYSAFICLVFLKRTSFEFQNIFHKNFYPENIIVSSTILLAIILFWKFLSGLDIILPLIILALVIYLTFLIPAILGFYNKKYEQENNENRKKNTYLIFMFLWLASLSAVPVIQYYYSIKSQEEQFWKQEQFFSVARDNLKLQADFKDYEAAWFKKIMGNGIDSLKVSYSPFSEKSDSDTPRIVPNFNLSDIIYTSLPDPITNGYSHPDFLRGENYQKEWFINDTLLYTKGGQAGTVYVTSNNKSHISYFYWTIRVIITFFIIAGSVWLLLKYVASIILNLEQENPIISDILWLNFIVESRSKRILLKTFNGECFFSETNSFIDKRNNSDKKKINATVLPFKQIYTNQIIEPDFNCETFLSKTKSNIWISGLDQCIYQLDKHELLLSRLLLMNQKSDKNIVVEVSFDFDIIDEFYNDYIADNEIEKEKIAQIFLLRKRWKTIFKNYYEFKGYLNQNRDSKPSNEETYQYISKNTEIENCIKKSWEVIDKESQFSNIWDNLTGFEKIVLYDLADDGLLNRKNKYMINKLMDKRLIIPKPCPQLFSADFRDFVKKSLSPAEVKTIENKLGLKGKWRNIQYLIFLILIPLAAFIIISQGISIEKVFGIFAGGLTVIAGLMRLLDSNIFRQPT